jgi:hypothetical protein
MIGALWRLTRGYRLHPWDSPYLRWRIETYWGVEAEGLSPRQVRRFIREHRGELLRFLRWADRMQAASRGQHRPPLAVRPDAFE